jgi:hypothetical protein
VAVEEELVNGDGQGRRPTFDDGFQIGADGDVLFSTPIGGSTEGRALAIALTAGGQLEEPLIHSIELFDWIAWIPGLTIGYAAGTRGGGVVRSVPRTGARPEGSSVRSRPNRSGRAGRLGFGEVQICFRSRVEALACKSEVSYRIEYDRAHRCDRIFGRLCGGLRGCDGQKHQGQVASSRVACKGDLCDPFFNQSAIACFEVSNGCGKRVLGSEPVIGCKGIGAGAQSDVTSEVAERLSRSQVNPPPWT